MSRTSTDQYVNGRLINGFDYTNQAWVRNGRYVRCGHPESMNCGCYGRQHEGKFTPVPHTRWTTIIEVRTPAGWTFYSQQSVVPGEPEMTDEQYLAVCLAADEDKELRIAPTQGYQVCASVMPAPVVWPID